MSDRLNKLFFFQNYLQMKIGFDITRMSASQRQRYIEKMFIGIITESCEAMEETEWKKPWKHSVKTNDENLKEEIVDAWHFLINLSLASGMDADELFKMFTEKNTTNKKRQKHGY